MSNFIKADQILYVAACLGCGLDSHKEIEITHNEAVELSKTTLYSFTTMLSVFTVQQK